MELRELVNSISIVEDKLRNLRLIINTILIYNRNPTNTEINKIKSSLEEINNIIQKELSELKSTV